MEAHFSSPSERKRHSVTSIQLISVDNTFVFETWPTVAIQLSPYTYNYDFPSHNIRRYMVSAIVTATLNT